MTAYGYRAVPGNATPILVSIPHTGTQLPDATISSFADPRTAALPMTDWYLHELYDFLPQMGIETLFAYYSRYLIDLNRDPNGAALYPGRFETGLVPLTDFDGNAIFSEPPDAETIEQLRARFHAPYHARLKLELEQRLARHGRAVLIDAHSIVSRANQIHAALEQDICLGNRDGQSCDDWLIDCVEQVFVDNGYTVSRNDPYKGGYITAHYGRLPGVDALQIEMCQRLYMNEDDLSRDAGACFSKMQACLIEVMANVAAAVERN